MSPLSVFKKKIKDYKQLEYANATVRTELPFSVSKQASLLSKGTCPCVGCCWSKAVGKV